MSPLEEVAAAVRWALLMALTAVVIIPVLLVTIVALIVWG